LLKFIYCVTKGNNHWDWPQALAGFIDASSCKDIHRDAVYWWNQYTLELFGVPLSGLRQFLDDNRQWDNVLVFGGNEEALRNRFSVRVTLAGYPQPQGAKDEAFFSFHNLRAGFITTAYLNAGSGSVAEQAVLERTGIQAGWADHSVSQLVYIKRAAIRNSIASALVNPGIPFIDRHVVDDPTRFHQLDGPLVAKYPDSYHSQYVNHHVLEYIRGHCDVEDHEVRNLYCYVMREYMSNHVAKPKGCSTSGYNKLCNLKFTEILKNPAVTREIMSKMIDFMKYLCQYVLNLRLTIFRKPEVAKFIECCAVGGRYSEVVDIMNAAFFKTEHGECKFTVLKLKRLNRALVKEGSLSAI
jgi:hypothetical protein